MTSRPDKIRFRGKTHDVRDVVRIGGQRYFVIGTFGRRGNIRQRAVRKQGRDRDEFTIHRLENTRENRDRIANLKRTGKSSLPTPQIVYYQSNKKELLVVSEYVPGQSLRSYLRSRPQIGIYDAARLHCQLVQQTFTLNSRLGVIHGDISPDNLIISPKATRLVLIDFGSSFRFSRTTNRDEGDGANFVYQAPEINAGNPPTRHSEQFSCAVVLFEMITRTVPYDGMGGRVLAFTSEKDAVAMLNSELGEVVRSIPNFAQAAFREFLSRALSLNAGDRYPTNSDWKAFAEKLFEQLKYLPSDSPPETPFKQFLDACRSIAKHLGLS